VLRGPRVVVGPPVSESTGQAAETHPRRFGDLVEGTTSNTPVVEGRRPFHIAWTNTKPITPIRTSIFCVLVKT